MLSLQGSPDGIHDALQSVSYTESGITYGAVGGVLDETPLLGHVSSYLLIQGLIYTLLLFYFAMIYIWGITDAYKTSKKHAETPASLSKSFHLFHLETKK